MMFGKLGIVMIVVRDMERSVAFYRDVLGLKLLIHQENWSQFDAGNIIIGLHPEGDEVKVSPTTGISIGIYVDDMDKAVAEIRRRLAKIAVGPRPEPFGRWVWSSTPMDIASRLSKWRAVFALSTSWSRSSSSLVLQTEIPPSRRRVLQFFLAYRACCAT